VLACLCLLCFTRPLLAKTYTYDNLHRLKSVTYDNGLKIEYTYDAAGNILRVTHSGIVVL
jgi:YD repeat-containing protein